MASRNEPQMDREDQPTRYQLQAPESPSSALSAVFRAQAGANISEAAVIGPDFAGTTER